MYYIFINIKTQPSTSKSYNAAEGSNDEEHFYSEVFLIKMYLVFI